MPADPDAGPPMDPNWRCVNVVRSYAPGMSWRAAWPFRFVVICAAPSAKGFDEGWADRCRDTRGDQDSGKLCTFNVQRRGTLRCSLVNIAWHTAMSPAPLGHGAVRPVVTPAALFRGARELDVEALATRETMTRVARQRHLSTHRVRGLARRTTRAFLPHLCLHRPYRQTMNSGSTRGGVAVQFFTCS